MALTDWAIYRLSDGYIENVIWFDADIAQYTPPEGCAMIDIPGDGSYPGQWSMCGIGWSYINGQFIEPPYNPSAKTKLALPIDATNTEISVESTSFFMPKGKLLINKEIVSYTEISGNSFIGVVRGIDGTIAEDHLQGSSVYFSYQNIE